MVGTWKLLRGPKTLVCCIMRKKPRSEISASIFLHIPPSCSSLASPGVFYPDTCLFWNVTPFGGTNCLFKPEDCGKRNTWLESPALLVVGFVTLGDFVHISEPQFPHLSNGSKTPLCLPRGWLRSAAENTELLMADRGGERLPGTTRFSIRCLPPLAAQMGVCKAARLALFWSRERKAELIKSTANSAGYPQK